MTPRKCIVCFALRACLREVQGTFALTIEGKGFESRVSARRGMSRSLESGMRVCGACVQACPTATLREKIRHRESAPARRVGGDHLRPIAASAAPFKGPRCAATELVRMVPYKDGKANRGHSCVKGRFAYGYAATPTAILNPMVREKDHRSLAAKSAGREAYRP